MMGLIGLRALLALVAAPQERSLEIQGFDAIVRVNTDRTLDVTERITVRFNGTWNGLYRTIPVEYRTPQGFNWTLGLDLDSATDDANNQLRVESSRERHYRKYKIWVPGATDVTRTIVLRYRATNGLRFFEDHDELYWNITGDEWDVPIGSASATIELPPGATGIRATAFNGAYGSTDRDAVVETNGTSIRIVMPKPLGFREGLTAVVGWDKGLVPQPTATDRVLAFVRSNWPLVIPIPVFILAYSVWRRRGRDPRRNPISVQYEPPESLTPGEAGALIDNSADMRDITATMVDLAVRGYLRFEEKNESKMFGLIDDRDYVLHRVKPPSEWNTLAPHEQKVLEGLFDSHTSQVTLSDLENQFYKGLSGIKDGIFNRLLGHGFYRARPDRVQAAWVFGGVVFGVALAIGGAAFANAFSLTPVPFVVAGVLSLLILIGFGLQMPARTEGGARALEKVLGFQEFLSRVEAEHMERIVKHPELFDRFLPYAMAFGVEKKWAKAFEGIYTQPPSWYTGPSYAHFNVAHFSNSLSGFSSKASTTMASSPRSSSGSGFSGGSSGGGGGGGGGGGF